VAIAQLAFDGLATFLYLASLSNGQSAGAFLFPSQIVYEVAPAVLAAAIAIFLAGHRFWWRRQGDCRS
jgi:hypothetical protein